jgi:hypothetical protein
LKPSIFYALNALWILLCAVPAAFAAFYIVSASGLVGVWAALLSLFLGMVIAVTLFAAGIALARALRLIR